MLDSAIHPFSFVMTLALVLSGCGDDSPATACMPGTTQACVGAASCMGEQSCLPAGHGWGSCECEAPPPVDAGSSDAGGNSDGGFVVRDTLTAVWCPSTDTAPGYYDGTLAANFNDLENVLCAATAAGRDGMARVSVPPGATLSATYESLEGDGVLYILATCPIIASCLDGANDTTSGAESVEWTNSGGAAASVYVVLDNESPAGSGSFTLDLVLN